LDVFIVETFVQSCPLKWKVQYNYAIFGKVFNIFFLKSGGDQRY